MTNSKLPSTSFTSRRFPLGSASQIHKQWPAANLRHSAAPLPSKKSKKGRATRPWILDLGLWTLYPLAASLGFHRFPSGSAPQIHKPLPAENLRQHAPQLPSKKTKKGSAVATTGRPVPAGRGCCIHEGVAKVIASVNFTEGFQPCPRPAATFSLRRYASGASKSFLACRGMASLESWKRSARGRMASGSSKCGMRKRRP